MTDKDAQRRTKTHQGLHSNLSRIKPKLRTEGRVSGNFGRNKVKAANNSGLGVTKADKVGNLPTQQQYLRRLYDALDATTDPKLLSFIQEQIRSIHIQRGVW